jgi:hypothetical protein
MERKTDIQGLSKQSRDRVRELFHKQILVDEDKTGAKHAQFLGLLKNRYGYSNDKAVVELERLLKQFDSMNKSLGIHRDRPNSKHPHGS